jgi:hypothetical protein
MDGGEELTFDSREGVARMAREWEIAAIWEGGEGWWNMEGCVPGKSSGGRVYARPRSVIQVVSLSGRLSILQCGRGGE